MAAIRPGPSSRATSCSSELVYQRLPSEGLSLKKRQTVSEFALYVRHHTAQAIRIEVPLGFLESQEPLDDDDYKEVLDESRSRFSSEFIEEDVTHTPFRKPQTSKQNTERGREKTPVVERPPVIETQSVTEYAPRPNLDEATDGTIQEVVPEQPKKNKQRDEVPPGMGRGGRQHRYLQELIKGLAETEGFLARIEEEVLDGSGFVDVTLSKGEDRIACEISITTPAEKEVENIKKCFAAGYHVIWVISPEQKHLNAIRNLSDTKLSQTQRKAVLFLRPEDIPAAFSDRPSPPMESTVRGYRVRVKKAGTSFDETQSKRATVAEVLAKSVRGD